MKTILPSMILILSLITTEAKSMSSPTGGTDNTHIVLANPTARNIEIVRFLIENKIFKVNTNKVNFVGVYHRGQSYDFELSRKYILENQYSDVTDPMRHLFELSFGFHLMGSSRNPEFRPFMEERPGYLVTGL